MRDKIYQMLRDATGFPVMYQQRPEEFPSLTYHFYNAGGKLFGDGKAVRNGGICQIDLWSKDGQDEERIEKIVAAAHEMFGANAEWNEDYERQEKIYHTTITFEFVKER